MRKKDRQHLIKRLLIEKNIQKQEDFVLLLQEKGVEVTQATISRDIKDMKLIKQPSPDGSYRYSLPNLHPEDVSIKIDKLLTEAFVSVDQMEKYVILHTIPGNATAAARLLEKQYKKQLFAVLNDDDGVLMITKEQSDAVFLKEELEKYL